MPRKKSTSLTEAELRLMDVVWDKGSATVQEVADALPRELDLAYNTVLTTLRILEDKGYLRHKKAKEGRAFVYSAAVSREQASRSAVHSLLRRFFRQLGGGSCAESSGRRKAGGRRDQANPWPAEIEAAKRGRIEMTLLAIFTAVFNTFWQAAALAALVWLALKCVRMNAATRCVIWWVVLTVLVLLPFAPRAATLWNHPRALPSVRKFQWRLCLRSA